MHKISLSKFSKVVYFAEFLSPPPKARGRRGCPPYVDTLLVAVDNLLDLPQLGVDVPPTASVIEIVAVDGVGHTAVDVSNSKFIHIDYLSFWYYYIIE
jgi:hypothetical protein